MIYLYVETKRSGRIFMAFVTCNRFAKLPLTLGVGKKRIETFRQPTRATEMKGQASVIKSPWAAIDFSLASITSNIQAMWTRFVYRVYEYRRGGSFI